MIIDVQRLIIFPTSITVQQARIPSMEDIQRLAEMHQDVCYRDYWLSDRNADGLPALYTAQGDVEYVPRDGEYGVRIILEFAVSSELSFGDTFRYRDAEFFVINSRTAISKDTVGTSEYGITETEEGKLEFSGDKVNGYVEWWNPER